MHASQTFQISHSEKLVKATPQEVDIFNRWLKEAKRFQIPDPMLSVQKTHYSLLPISPPRSAPLITNVCSMNATTVLIAHLQNLNNQKIDEISPRLQV